MSKIHIDKMNNLFLNVPTLGRPANVFVQCTSYDLKLPLSGLEKRVLDIFEETIHDKQSFLAAQCHAEPVLGCQKSIYGHT